jgi:hypothetical protein
VFPACEKCNSASRLDELVMTAVVRFRVSNFASEEDELEFEKAVDNLRRYKPGLLDKLKEYSRAQTRRWFKDRGMGSANLPGVGELYIVEYPDEMHEATERYAMKLGKALHYFHTGKIIPESGLVRGYPYTNSADVPPEAIENTLRAMTNKSVTKRDQTLLDGQFTYRYGIVEEGEGSAYVVVFGESLLMLIMAVMDGAAFERRRAERQAQLAQNGGSATSA